MRMFVLLGNRNALVSKASFYHLQLFSEVKQTKSIIIFMTVCATFTF